MKTNPRTGNTNISVTIDPITHQVSFSQPQAWNGTETVRFTAADTENNSTQSNPVSLQVQGVENPPVLDFVPDITVNENDLVKITPNATDLDADPITYSFIAPLNANGQWQTDYISAGTYTTTVTASDPTGLKDTQDVKIVVRNVNRLPVISAINGIPVTAGQPVVIPGINEEAVLQITPAASDPDNETVNFYYSAPLDSTGKWITDYDDAGICTATVTASDSIDTVTQQVRITVLNVNRPPVFTLVLSKYTVGPNETFSVTLSASDPDDNTMTYSLKKDGVEFSSGPISTPGMSAVTSFSSIGDHTISAVVTDAGGLQCSDQAAVDVYDPSPNVNAINPVMGDFNGDSLSDLGLHNSDTGTWEICLSEAGAFNASIDWLTGFGASRDWWPVGGDFNGDGRTDIGIYNNTTGELKIALSDGAKFNISGTWLTFSGASYSWIPVTGNFNGDKFTDFGLYNKDTGEWKVAKGTGSGFSEFTTWLMSFGSADHTPLTGDFNADGLTDICIFKKSAGEFKVAFSNTKAFIPNQNPWITNYAVDKDPIISDFNSDGLTDVGYFDKSRGKWFQALNTTSAFTDSGVWLEGFGFSSDESGHTGDFNGDGITDAAAFDRDQLGINRWAVKLVNKKPQDLLVEVDNGIGGKTQITYQYASTYNNE
ncbi:MAG: hypothetical protein NTV07_00290, partial [Candidatus Omnitrophica bacterium]|nr:hypothetical protein [Candidatus Omnitrophota bacterium]